MFQENKAPQIFQKTIISYPLVHFLCACGYQGVKNVRFSENLACFVFLKHSFWDSAFYLFTDEIKQFEKVFCNTYLIMKVWELLVTSCTNKFPRDMNIIYLSKKHRYWNIGIFMNGLNSNELSLEETNVQIYWRDK